MSAPPQRPNWTIDVIGERHEMMSEPAVVASAKKSGTAACRTVHSTRSACETRSPRRRSMRDCPHVSWSTKMLSALTPMTTARLAAAKAESGRCPKKTQTRKYMIGKARTSWPAARNASRPCPK